MAVNGTKKLSVAFLIIVVLIACTDFYLIKQPESADINSRIQIPIKIDIEQPDNQFDGQGVICVRLPLGWTVEDSMPYSGIHSGVFTFFPPAVDSMVTRFGVKAGYYWWAGISDSISALQAGYVSFTATIQTDAQVGSFALDYLMYSTSGNGSFSSFNHPIDVGLPQHAVVTNTNDDGPGSLRNAIRTVGADAEIEFDLAYPALIELDSQLVVKKSLSIMGPSSGQLILSGKGITRLFYVLSDTGSIWYDGTASGGWGRACHPCGPIHVELSNLVISDGNALSDSSKGYLLINSQGIGGGIFATFAHISISGVVISDNIAERWAAIYSSGGPLYINKSTIAGNRSTDGYSAAIGSFKFGNIGSPLPPNDHISNTIIWNDTDSDSVRVPGAIIYSNVRGGAAGIGNINSEPNFADTLKGNYRLQNGSPGIDAGIQDFIHAFEFWNVFDTLFVPPMDYFGSAPDMGAYEYEPTSTEIDDAYKPSQVTLHQNFPNPFNPQTSLSYHLPENGYVTLVVYNVLGKEVATLVSGAQSKGDHTLVWAARDMASGTYFYRLTTPSSEIVRKMLLLR